LTATVPWGLISGTYTLSVTMWLAAHAGYYSQDGGQTWSQVNSDLTGLGVKDFALVPGLPNTLLAGTGSGVFQSSDGGSTWQERNDGLTGIVPYALAVSPSTPNDVYVVVQWEGLLRSNNGGSSWQKLGVVRRGMPWQAEPLAVDPFDPARIYMGDTSEEQLPSLRISADGGGSWHAVTVTMPFSDSGWTGEVFAVKPHPTLAGRLLVGATFFPPGYDSSYPSRPWGGIYGSDDHGETLDYLGPSQPISGVVQFAYDAVDPNLVYAGTEGTGLWKSIDGGATWQEATPDGNTWYLWSVVADPYQANKLWIGLWNAGSQPVDSMLLESTDAGAAMAGQAARGAGRATSGALGGGVYRYTSVLADWHHLYLPLVSK
jgi:hypothetical protein